MATMKITLATGETETAERFEDVDAYINALFPMAYYTEFDEGECRVYRNVEDCAHDDESRAVATVHILTGDIDNEDIDVE